MEVLRVTFLACRPGGVPPGKLADVELLFLDGPLSGLRLLGFSIWEARTATSPRVVQFPSRMYAVNGERRSFCLLRPASTDAAPQDRVRDLILTAYAEFEKGGQ